MENEKWKRALQVLGLNNDSNFHEIRLRYRDLILKYSPDANQTKNTQKRFRKIVEAYCTIVEMMDERKTVHR